MKKKKVKTTKPKDSSSLFDITIDPAAWELNIDPKAFQVDVDDKTFDVKTDPGLWDEDKEK
ncbi:MAG: hypothetical protein CMK61_01920 [Pseudoalteromonadaceae bacterium]|jgi:hypothetical protein|nr:hypothetical protein [Pseudoalteromonadaceae bacterium]|tara:strand:- start:666 stop:848 length:183 start_codon:yes stop_codon:yes gene_type:complete